MSAPGGWEAAALAAAADRTWEREAIAAATDPARERELLEAASDSDRLAFTLAADLFADGWNAAHPDAERAPVEPTPVERFHGAPRIAQDGPRGPGEGDDTTDGPQAAHGAHAGPVHEHGRRAGHS